MAKDGYDRSWIIENQSAVADIYKDNGNFVTEIGAGSYEELLDILKEVFVDIANGKYD